MQQLKAIDYGYVMLSSLAGAAQWLCFSYSGSALLVIPMGLPFALLSYAYALLRSRTSEIREYPDWRRALILWVGMPLSLALGASAILAETGIMSIAGFGVVNLPFDNLRRLIGEGVACLAWAACLVWWSNTGSSRLRRRRLLWIFVVLFVGVLFVSGLSKLIIGIFHNDVYFILASVIVTTLSALILVFLRKEVMTAGTDSDLAANT